MAINQLLIQTFERNYDRLLAIPGVNYLDIGNKYTEGKIVEGIEAIRAFVDKKLSKDKLDIAHIIPEELEGIPTDIIESIWELQNSIKDQYYNPVIGSIHLYSKVTRQISTLGGVFYSALHGKVFGISTMHTFVNQRYGIGEIGDLVYQPSIDKEPLGTIKAIYPECDCALIEIDLNVRKCITNNILHIISGSELRIPITNIIKGLEDIYFDSKIPLFKIGLATEYTEGFIDGVNLKTLELTIRSFEDSKISDRGDCGAIWINKDNSTAFGMHHQGDIIGNYYCRAFAMHPIFSRFNFILGHTNQFNL